MVDFMFQLKYLLKPDSQYYSLSYFILKQSLEKMEENENKNQNFLVEFFKKYFIFALFLATKFFDWYFQPSNSIKQGQNLDQKVVSLPFKKEVHSRTFNYCNLCNKDFRNPTVLACSGYVFCYTCIEEFVKKHGKCPITHINCSLKGLHKIYKN